MPPCRVGAPTHWESWIRHWLSRNTVSFPWQWTALLAELHLKAKTKLYPHPHTMPTVNKFHCLQCYHPFFCSIIRLPTTTLDRQPCLRECLFPYIITNSGVFPKCFSLNSAVTKKFMTLKGLEPAISCVRDQHATTAPGRHIWETGSSNWAQFTFQWFISFSEFSEFSSI